MQKSSRVAATGGRRSRPAGLGAEVGLPTAGL